MTTRFIRWTLTAGLLTFVWMQSGWAVALSITLLTVAEELRSETDRLRRARERDEAAELSKLIRGAFPGSGVDR